MPSIAKIIESSVDSDKDLLKLARAVAVRVDQIVFKQYFDQSKNYSILNMGTPLIGGTHWVAVSNKDKQYFDPLALPPTDRHPKQLQTVPLPGTGPSIWTLWRLLLALVVLFAARKDG
ncbi:unnamed protein product [Phytophthora lilii]|uniref:Unnamed protein product n=1 Tax=Phytophthora lilii TaxID=2077276 RepID=A0A9W7CNG4_9STRA|nr:unnamed protein product [Phytophthora lilii]